MSRVSKRVHRPCVAAAIAILLCSAGQARAQDQQHAGHTLGTVDFPVSCSEQAQVEFNRAVALLHHMTYPQAREAFQHVVATELNARVAQKEGQSESAVALLREAAELEASTPNAVTPAPTLPAYEQLGDLLMEQNQPAEGLTAYTRSMELYPKRFNGLLDAARAARALGDTAVARTFYRELLAVADGGTRQPSGRGEELLALGPRPYVVLRSD